MKRFILAAVFCASAWAFVTQANAKTIEVTLDVPLDSSAVIVQYRYECGSYTTGGCAIAAADTNREKLIAILGCVSETGKYDVNIDYTNSKFQLWTDEDTELSNATDLTGEVVVCTVVVGPKFDN